MTPPSRHIWTGASRPIISEPVQVVLSYLDRGESSRHIWTGASHPVISAPGQVVVTVCS